MVGEVGRGMVIGAGLRGVRQDEVEQDGVIWSGVLGWGGVG